MSRLTKYFADRDEYGHNSCHGGCESCTGVLCGDAFEMIKKLAHYEDLEEQGRLIVGHKDPVGEQGPEGKGQWIDNHCSICGMTPLGEEIWEHLDLDPPRFELYMNSCPNCGAKMEVE